MDRGALQQLRTLVGVLTYNNGRQARETLARFPATRDYGVVVHDDGSTDDTPSILQGSGFEVIRSEVNRGVGGSIKRVARHARECGYDVLVIMAGNSKDDPAEIPRLLEPIAELGYDYVQGSRFAPGGRAENLPLFRHVMVRVHALLFSALTGVRCTDALNGFRAYRLSLLFDAPRINVWQDWLDTYEYETYLTYKVLKLGYRATEVPVVKSYASFARGEKYSHIRPLVDWWRIMRPLVYLTLGLRS